MPSIVNGLFSGRSGISSHGNAIAVVGDNISNASTVGYKTSRAEFEDIIAGGQTSGKVVGSGSSTSAISTLFEQGTLEFTGRPLDLAVDGNGFFVVADGSERFYTRAGNFKVDASGRIVNQNDLAVLGFPADGTGALEELNVNTISQDSVATTSITVTGNVNAASSIVGSIPAVPNAGAAPSGTVTYADLNDASDGNTVVKVYDSLGAAHDITFFFFHTGSGQYTVRGYVNSEEVDPSGSEQGRPRLVTNGTSGDLILNFDTNGAIDTSVVGTVTTLAASIPWNNGSSSSAIDLDFSQYTQFASNTNVQSISQDGEGIGSIASVSIDTDGTISALLTNGQTATIGTVGLVNFANPEGLVRIGKSLLQQSNDSGEPVVGRPLSGTFGAVNSGSVELSTVDIANEFVKLITLQRGFQANSRIITTINQLLNEIIQLA